MILLRWMPWRFEMQIACEDCDKMSTNTCTVGSHLKMKAQIIANYEFVRVLSLIDTNCLLLHEWEWGWLIEEATIFWWWKENVECLCDKMSNAYVTKCLFDSFPGAQEQKMSTWCQVPLSFWKYIAGGLESPIEPPEKVVLWIDLLSVCDHNTFQPPSLIFQNGKWTNIWISTRFLMSGGSPHACVREWFTSQKFDLVSGIGNCSVKASCTLETLHGLARTTCEEWFMVRQTSVFRSLLARTEFLARIELRQTRNSIILYFEDILHDDYVWLQ